MLFTWLKDDLPILTKQLDNSQNVENLSFSDENSIAIRQNDDFTSALSIMKITKSQGGNYTCMVQNDAAKVFYSAQLKVNGKFYDLIKWHAFFLILHEI